ncbi:MAG TPA: efflux transporter outer membrane subunit [Verrucomicrobiae bacterium]|jgi:multidrug efflux system outer membrane protein
MKTPAALCALCALMIAGCAVGPNYHRPDVHAPASFRGQESSETNSLGDLLWWQMFQDANLQSLIQTALTNSYDLRAAVARLEQSRAMLAESRSQFYPQVNYQAAAGVERNAVGGSPYDLGAPPSKFNYLDGSVAWEIDLWGRIRRMTESSRARFLATDQARREVLSSLAASVAQSYFQLLALDEEMEIARQTTNSFAESLRIFSERLRGGVSSKLETSAAEAALASAAAAIPELRRQIVFQEDQLRVELGLYPGPIERRSEALRMESMPDVPAGLPSDLLERRPDVRQAEELMRAASANIGVAKANFYPRFALTGVFGETSLELAAFTSGSSAAWNVAANLAGPIFQGGLLKAQLRQARAAWDESRFQYQSSVLNAFQEVSDALASRRELSSEGAEQRRAVAAYEDAVRVASERYKGGQANYYELLQEQQLLFPAQNALVQTQLNQLLASIQLYKALGGGWNAVPLPAPSSR